MNTKTEQRFVMNTNDNKPSSTTPRLVETTEPAQVNLENVQDFSNVCRTCAMVTEFVIPIFEGEGLQNNLAEKIKKHLPITVTEQDVLPKVVCYQCASTLFAWHELVKCCVQADEALRSRLPNLTSSAPKDVKPSISGSSQPVNTNQKNKPNKITSANQLDEDEAREVMKAEPKVSVDKHPVVSVGEDGKKYAACQYCDKNIALSSWKRHVRRHEGERRYSCATCGLAFNDSGNLARHTKALHGKLRPHVCQLCNKAFSRSSHLQDHVKSHSDSREFVCHVCGKASKSSAALRMHGRTHGARRLGCVQCGARFKRRAELAAHVTVHTGERAHRARNTPTVPPPRYRESSSVNVIIKICTFCGLDLPEPMFETHIIDKHAELVFHCDECGNYVERKEFIIHMSQHAMVYVNDARPETEQDRKPKIVQIKRDENENTAPESIAETPPRDTPSPHNDTNANNNSSEFADHGEFEFEPLPESVFEAIDDSGEDKTTDQLADPPLPNDEAKPQPKSKKTRTCPICSKSYSASSSYFYHMKHAHGTRQEFSCEVCGKTFASRANLAQHGLTHSTECGFECKWCAKRFRARASLYIHEQIHVGGRQHECGQCGRGFRWRSQLARHMSRHARSRAHGCGACGRAFATRCDLRRHAHTHRKGNYPCDICGVNFAQQRYLNTHHKNKHKDNKNNKNTTKAKT